MAMTTRIDDFAEKLKLTLRSGRSKVKTEEQLLRELGVSKDFLSRVKNGMRVLAEDKLVKLSELFSLRDKDWFLPLTEFGEMLGFSRYEIFRVSGAQLPGFDLHSRIKDEFRIKSLFSIMQGYWESYYYSVSKVGEILVSRDLLVVQSVTPDGFIECEIVDGSSTYSGYCFPIPNHLYFILEKKVLLNEVIVYATNLPDRFPPALYGVILCLSGGVDEHHSFPAAAKVAFRYLGTEDLIRKKHGIPPDLTVREYIEREVPGYVDPKDTTLDSQVSEILKAISNIVLPETVPNALRMSK